MKCQMCRGYGELSMPPYDDSGVCSECNGTGEQPEPEQKREPSSEKTELVRTIRANEKTISELKRDRKISLAYGVSVTEKLKIAVEALEGALLIEDLWIPPVVSEEYVEEAKALHAMKDSFVKAISQINESGEIDENNT